MYIYNFEQINKEIRDNNVSFGLRASNMFEKCALQKYC